MERKIGETFEYEDKKLQVKESERISCYGCFFDEQCLPLRKEVAGECEFEYRTDKKEVIFVEATEQPQEQAEQQTEQPQGLNLCEILKNCPKGFKLYSVVYGEVTFLSIKDGIYPICVLINNNGTEYFSSSGKLCESCGECLLFPSKEQRDWSKFTAPWLKKEKFDPKTLKPFDKVIARNTQSNSWAIEYFSHIDKNRCEYYPFFCLGDNYAYCIPYNADTKHLLGSKDEAPEFYRYWEN